MLFYRHKVLLGLIEIFGGRLNARDCYKLMFLLCQRSQVNHYDFFPYKNGAWSSVLQGDLSKLEQRSYLTSNDNSWIISEPTFLRQLKPPTQMELDALKNSKIGRKRGNSLVRQIYLDYPYYASRSEIASRILSEEQYHLVEQTKNIDGTSCLFTIGYEGISLDYYLNELNANNIAVLVDVRANPFSRKFGFSKKQLKQAVHWLNIDYFHIPELGIPSHKRQNLNGEQDYSDLFQEYEESILPDQTDALSRLRSIIKEKKRVALTCFEADHNSCHRSKIVEYFQQVPTFSIPVKHI